MLTMDLHSKEVQGFYDCPVDNLRASPFLIQYIQDRVSNDGVYTVILFQHGHNMKLLQVLKKVLSF